MEERVKTRIWIQSFMKRFSNLGFMLTVAKRGDDDAGAVFLKINCMESGCRVYTHTRNDKGSFSWISDMGSEMISEEEAGKYVQRQIKYDPDIWVVEIEDPKGIIDPEKL